MLKSTVARSLLLASALATGAIGAALAQQTQEGPAPAPVSAPQDQTQAQPIGNASNEGLAGMPVDQQTTVSGGVQAVCSGIGKGDQTTPSGQGVKFEMVGGYGQWLGNAHLTVTSASGQQVASAQCSGPWVVMNLSPGRYSATADVPDGGSKTMNVSVPASGNSEVIFRFTNMQQGQSPQHDQNAPANGT